MNEDVRHLGLVGTADSVPYFKDKLARGGVPFMLRIGNLPPELQLELKNCHLVGIMPNEVFETDDDTGQVIRVTKKNSTLYAMQLLMADELCTLYVHGCRAIDASKPMGHADRHFTLRVVLLYWYIFGLFSCNSAHDGCIRVITDATVLFTVASLSHCFSIYFVHSQGRRLPGAWRGHQHGTRRRTRLPLVRCGVSLVTRNATARPPLCPAISARWTPVPRSRCLGCSREQGGTANSNTCKHRRGCCRSRGIRYGVDAQAAPPQGYWRRRPLPPRKNPFIQPRLGCLHGLHAPREGPYCRAPATTAEGPTRSFKRASQSQCGDQQVPSHISCNRKYYSCNCFFVLVSVSVTVATVQEE